MEICDITLMGFGVCEIATTSFVFLIGIIVVFVGLAAYADKRSRDELQEIQGTILRAQLEEEAENKKAGRPYKVFDASDGEWKKPEDLDK
jgi:hypothetical protein